MDRKNALFLCIRIIQNPNEYCLDKLIDPIDGGAESKFDKCLFTKEDMIRIK